MAQFNQLNLTFPIPVVDGGIGNSSVATNKILVGAGTSAMIPTDLNASSGIILTKISGTWTIASSPSSVGTWTTVSGTSQVIICGNGYIPNNVSQVVFTLPSTAEVGCVFEIAGLGLGGWRIDCNAGQQLVLGTVQSSVGGSMASTDPTDYVRVLCVVADTIFKVLPPQGNLGLT